MSEVLSKTHLCSSWNRSQQHHRRSHHRRRLSVLPSQSSNLKCAAASSSSSLCSDLKLSYRAPKSPLLSGSSSSDFYGKSIGHQGRNILPAGRISRSRVSIVAATGLRIGKAQKWWEKGLQSNMKEVTGAQDLVDSLLDAGDKLVVVDFYSPGCGGCKALHPKICQIAEMNPDVLFLQVNYEEHKSMCYSLHVHVLPFFRFYRGAHGRLCSFSCTNATIKKFRDALAKHSPDRSSIGPIKGLEEKELVALASNKELSFTYTPKQDEPVPVPAEEAAVLATKRALSEAQSLSQAFQSTALNSSGQDKKENALVATGR